MTVVQDWLTSSRNAVGSLVCTKSLHLFSSHNNVLGRDAIIALFRCRAKSESFRSRHHRKTARTRTGARVCTLATHLWPAAKGSHRGGPFPVVSGPLVLNLASPAFCLWASFVKINTTRGSIPGFQIDGMN